MPTPVQSGLDGGGDQVEEEADEPGTSCAEFVVAALVVVTSVLTHALDRQ